MIERWCTSICIFTPGKHDIIAPPDRFSVATLAIICTSPQDPAPVYLRHFVSFVAVLCSCVPDPQFDDDGGEVVTSNDDNEDMK